MSSADANSRPAPAGHAPPAADGHTRSHVRRHRPSSAGAAPRSPFLASPAAEERPLAGRSSMQVGGRMQKSAGISAQGKALFDDGLSVMDDTKKMSQPDLLPQSSAFTSQKDGSKRHSIREAGVLCKQDITFRPSSPVSTSLRSMSKDAALEPVETYEWLSRDCVLPSAHAKRLSRSHSYSSSVILASKQEAQSPASVSRTGDGSPRRVGINRTPSLRDGELPLAHIRNAWLCRPSPSHRERWAGPAYTTSPPPSSLPLPKFPSRQLRSCCFEMYLSEKMGKTGQTPHPVSVSPGKEPASCYSGFDLQEGSFNATFATKDLRRILNLDSC